MAVPEEMYEKLSMTAREYGKIRMTESLGGAKGLRPSVTGATIKMN